MSKARDGSVVNRLGSVGKRFTITCGQTSVTFYVHGLGDHMIAREFVADMQDFFRLKGDPELGRIVITTGYRAAEFPLQEGDLHMLWWWSMGARHDWLDDFLNNTPIIPDLVLCPSAETLREAESKGLETLYLPLAVGRMFQPLGQRRAGIGYAGSRRHKDRLQEKCMVRDLLDRYEVDWVDNIAVPSDLNAWYNTKLIALGMTESFQEAWGQVNNRVFEALASGTPFVIHRHHSLEEVLGFDFPFQSRSSKETEFWVKEILSNPDMYMDQFNQYAALVRANHTYFNRIEKILAKIQTFLC